MKRHYLFLWTLCIFLSFKGFSQEFAVIEFEETEYNFGEVEQGEKVEHVYRFTNTGEIPLVITNVKGSCGCTVPFYPKDPILPGESSEIQVEFDSKGKKNKQSKRVTISANTDPSQTFLTIRGQVNAPDAGAHSEIKEMAMLRGKEEKELEAFSKNCFAIYPNPTSEILQLELKDYIAKSAKIEIRNEIGQKVMDKKIARISSESTRFDVSSFPAGIYVISISVENMKPMSQCFVVRGN